MSTQQPFTHGFLPNYNRSKMRCTGKMAPLDENFVNAHSQHRQNFSSGPGTSNFWTVVVCKIFPQSCGSYWYLQILACLQFKFWNTAAIHLEWGILCHYFSTFLCAVLCHSDHWLAIVVRSTWCNSQLLQNQQPGENLQQRSFNFQTLETLR